jgi:hypothetical protein
MVMYGKRPVIPAALRQEVMETLHAGHTYVTTMMTRAAQSLFWPNMKQDMPVLHLQRTVNPSPTAAQPCFT